MDIDVLVAGAGPVGVTTALELRRRGVDVLIVDPRRTIAPWAKAVGVQPRTMEIWDQAGVIRRVLDVATSMRGQIVYVNGAQVQTITRPCRNGFPTTSSACPNTRPSGCWASAWSSWAARSTAGPR